MDEYYHAKNIMLTCDMVVKCDKNAVRETEKVLESLCVERVVERLKRFLSSPPDSPAPVVIYEILTQPDVLMNQSVLNLALRSFVSHGDSIKELCKREKCFMPSLIVLMTMKPLVGFASSVLNLYDHQYSMDEFEQAYPLVKKIITALRLWFMLFTLQCHG